MRSVYVVIICIALITGCASAPPSCYETRGGLNNSRPVYPLTSIQRGEEGKTLLRVFVNANGYPETIELRQSSGYKNLDQLATDAVKNWCFYPAQSDGKSVSAWVLVPIVFQLKSQ